MNKIILIILIASSAANAQDSIDGFLQSSNLSIYHKEKAQLKTSDYLLLTDEVNYLLESSMDVSKYLGQFCRIYGEAFESKEWLFDCIVYKVDSIVKINYELKNSNNEVLIQSIQNQFRTNYGKTLMDTLSGNIIRRERSSPDISGDYAIKLKEPLKFQDESGDEPVDLHEIPINHLNQDMLYKLELAFKKKEAIKLSGFLYSGYGHMLYLRALKIY